MIPAGHIWGPSLGVGSAGEVSVAAEGAVIDVADIDVFDVATPQRRKRGRPRKESPHRSTRQALVVHGRVSHAPSTCVWKSLLDSTDTWIGLMPLTHDSSLAAMRKALKSISTLDANHRLEHFDKVREHALGSKPRRLLPSLAETEALGFASNSATRVRDMFTSLGAAIFTVSRLAWGAALQHVIQSHDDGKLEIIVDLTCVASDETALEVGWESKFEIIGSMLLDQVSGTQSSRAATARRRDRSMTKLVQAELVKAIGVRWAGSSDYEVLICELPTKNYAGDSMTASNIFRIWTDITDDAMLASSLHSRAKYHVDLNCTDRGANCGKANRVFRFNNAGRIRFCDTGCALHNGHLATKCCIRPFRSIWSRCISFSLVQKPGGSEAAFRSSLQTAVRRRVWPRIATNPPGPQHHTMLYRKKLFDALVSAEDARRRVALEFYFKGDLRDSRIAVVVDEEMGASDALGQFLDTWAAGAAWALYPRRPPPLSSHRWLSNIESLNGIALLDLVHDIKREALQIFLSKTEDADQRNNTGEVTVVDGQVVWTSTPEDGNASASALWAALNKKTRMDMKQVCRQPVGMELLILSLALAPMCKLNQVIMHMDTDKWEQEQQMKLKRGERRLYRLLEARRGNVTKQFWVDTQNLMDNPDAWSALPSQKQTLQTRAKAFAAVASGQGSIWYYLDYVWQHYPFKALDLIDDELDSAEVAAGIKADCPHMYDDFMLEFLMRFLSVEGLCSTDAKMILVMIALQHYLTMMRIECRHASLRRLLLTKSTTLAETLPTLSSDWVLQRQRLVEQATRQMREFIEAKVANAPDVAEATLPQRAAATGPFRAWMSEWLGSDEAVAMHDMESKFAMGCEAYRSIKEQGGDKWNDLLKKGRVMTCSAPRAVQRAGPGPARPRQVQPGDAVVVRERPRSFFRGDEEGQDALQKLIAAEQLKTQVANAKAAEGMKLQNDICDALVALSTDKGAQKSICPVHKPHLGALA